MTKEGMTALTLKALLNYITSVSLNILTLLPNICKLVYATKLAPTISSTPSKNIDQSKAVHEVQDPVFNVNATFLKLLCRLSFCDYLEVMVMLPSEYSSSVTASGANKYSLDSGGQTEKKTPRTITTRCSQKPVHRLASKDSMDDIIIKHIYLQFYHYHNHHEVTASMMTE